LGGFRDFLSVPLTQTGSYNTQNKNTEQGEIAKNTKRPPLEKRQEYSSSIPADINAQIRKMRGNAQLFAKEIQKD
jgi:hypothetical protein